MTRLALVSVPELFASAKVELESAGCTAVISHSPDDGRNTHCVGLWVASGVAEGDLSVWDSREGELVIAASSEEVMHTHFASLTVEDVPHALTQLIDAVV